MNIFIYRPDLYQAGRINPDAVFTIRGRHFPEWQRDEQTQYDYKVELIKKKLSGKKNSWYVEDYWR